MIAMVVLGIAITITTSTILHIAQQGDDTKVSNYGYMLTKEKLMEYTRDGAPSRSVGTYEDTQEREGIRYTREAEVTTEQTVIVTTTWAVNGRKDSVVLRGRLRGSPCPDIGNNSPPESLTVYHGVAGDSHFTLEDGESADDSVRFFVAEGDSLSQNTRLATLVGHDPDIEEGDRLSFHLDDTEGDNAFFRITRDELYPAQPLDTGEYTLFIEVRDCFDETLTAEMTILVEQEFSFSITVPDVSIHEHYPDTSPYYDTFAYADPDSREVVQAELTGGSIAFSDLDTIELIEDGGGIFAITDEGLVYIQEGREKDLDYDTGTQNYTLRVTAEYDETNTASAFFTVSLKDVNEPPTGGTLSNVRVPKIPVGTGFTPSVGILRAEDPDRDESHTFEITSGSNVEITNDSILRFIGSDDESPESVTIEVTDRHNVDSDTFLGTVFTETVTVNLKRKDHSWFRNTDNVPVFNDNFEWASAELGDLVRHGERIYEVVNTDGAAWGQISSANFEKRFDVPEESE
ncbi:hypothetical protein CALK_0245 [Chitinivibrio alkaliphilus ACht1]|uniref:Cadherin domain-containing protein n=2 Tax=Chitinivibrio TaxID=1505231 RepID=U7D800_9BACT|nr:hypothetical protein CALK_0245 [Chitinivibrio alkaliphilus ACht1]